MPVIQINLGVGNSVNMSLQVGDTLYYVSTTTLGGFNISDGDIVEMGVATLVTPLSVQCEIPETTPPPSAGDFILFSKDSVANLNGMLGYYMLVEMACNDRDQAELFSLNANYFDSSK